ncbi:MAG: ATP-binding protein [Devosiaceae bacterium]|nr:ATP-binding protein [Devosiaceae bacterium]
MKNLLPDTIAVRAMVLLVVGLAFTHLVSNLFYSTDRESALLTAGGGHAIQWVAATGAFADKVSPQEWETIVKTANSDNRFVTLTDAPVVQKTGTDDWRDEVLVSELRRQVPENRIANYRIAYAQHLSGSTEIAYWQEVLSDEQLELPMEMVLVSLRLNNGIWLNVAAPIQSTPQFFSARLWLSMAVMIIAVVMISYVIVGRMTAPLKQLSEAAEKLGTDVQAPAIPETGPEEVRRTAHAFNVMQNRIRSFVQDRTQMLGAIAHDLGTPITRLRLRAEFVEDKSVREKMLRDLDDMQQMVASTLAFIREESASEPRAVVDLGSLLARVCDDIQDAGADVDLAEAPRGILLECGPIGLRRALGNLIDNAAKYGERATVSLISEVEMVRIIIDDDGPGIPEARQGDVFQPFRRLDDSRNQNIAGTGLGLAIARTIVRAHGGDIRISNRPEGGLRAELRLPVSGQIVQTNASKKPVAGRVFPEVKNNSKKSNSKKNNSMDRGANNYQRAHQYGAAGAASLASGNPISIPENASVESLLAGQWDDRNDLSRNRANIDFEFVDTSVSGGTFVKRMPGFSVITTVVASVKRLITSGEHYKQAGRRTGR